MNSFASVNVFGDIIIALMGSTYREMAENSIKILKDNVLHKKFKQAAYERAKEFDIKKIMLGYEDIYKQLARKMINDKHKR